MNKNTKIILSIGGVILVIVAGLFWIEKNNTLQSNLNTATPNKSTSETKETTIVQQNLKEDQEIRAGKVNFNETVCKSGTIVSAIDPIFVSQPDSKGRPIAKDGSFSVVTSSVGFQLVMFVNDKNEICLTSIAFPKSTGLIMVDANSTAIASSFPNGYLKMDMEGLRRMQELQSFKNVKNFMTTELKNKTLDTITKDLFEEYSTYFKLSQVFNDEIMGIANDLNKQNAERFIKINR